MSRKRVELRNEFEIHAHNRDKPQILDATNYVENAHLAVGFASRCWTEENGKGVFDTQAAMRVANELCAYMRLLMTNGDVHAADDTNPDSIDGVPV